MYCSLGTLWLVVPDTIVWWCGGLQDYSLPKQADCQWPVQQIGDIEDCLHSRTGCRGQIAEILREEKMKEREYQAACKQRFWQLFLPHGPKSPDPESREFSH